MADETREERKYSFNLKGNLIAGILTVIPLFVVWVVLDFLFSLLADAGTPLILGFSAWLAPDYPDLAHFLTTPGVLSVIALLFVLILLYFIGFFATFVIGQQMIELFERMMKRIPLVHTIYSSTKKLVSALQTKPSNVQRVVLIAFPNPGMRAIGFVMATFADAKSGQELAAVFVPTAPNPTSGYLEIVPVEALIATDMTSEQAMAMVLSGGAVAPNSVSIQPAGSS